MYELNKKEWYERQRRESPEKLLFIWAKARAKRNKIPFEIQEKDIIVPELCPILQIPLSMVEGTRSSSPSLDRIDNNLGYIPGNIRVISNQANRLKSCFTVEDVRRLLAYMTGDASE